MVVDITEEPIEPIETEEAVVSPEPDETFPGEVVHTVRSGDTVSSIAERYGSSVQAIVDANDLSNSALIYRGQALIIPVRIVPATATPTNTPIVIVVTATPTPETEDAQETPTDTPPRAGDTYTVQPGDTLSTIAVRFNTTVGALVRLNGIANINRIFVGQRLNLPVSDDDTATPEPDVTTTPDPDPIFHVVRPGDTLLRIAALYNVSLSDLARENRIANTNFIFTGQILRIPQS